MKNSLPLIEFNPKLPKLSQNESEVLKLLIEAAKLVAPLYKEQENKKYPGANFYPYDVTKKEIEKAAKKDKEILSPFTVVERINGKLVAIPYHIKYAKFLKPIAQKLEQAAATSNNKEFAKLLKIQAKVLIEGNYEEAIIASLMTKVYCLDISIGPSDNYDDHLFFAKASYQSWVGIVDIEGTEKLNNYKTITLSTTRKSLMPSEVIDKHDKVKAKVLDVIIFSGLISRTKFVGLSLPYDLNIIEKYGSEITLFNQPNDLRIKEQIVPTFKKMFSEGFRQGFNAEDLRRGYLRGVALHELAHSYLHYKNALKNLQDLFPVIDELAATILGLRMAGSLLLKDRINNKQLESMIVTFLCRSLYNIGPTQPLANGGTVFINFMLKVGALKLFKGIIVPNFMKIFVSLNELSDLLEELLAKGTYKEAESFIKKYT